MITSTFAHILLVVLTLSQCINSKLCGDFKYTDWLGNTFKVATKKKCRKQAGICTGFYKCKTKDGSVWDQAIVSSGWDWNNKACSDYESGFSGSDDMKCSNPNPSDPYNDLFDPVCKIHDMCLKTDSTTQTQCHTDLYYNMVEICKMKYPYLVGDPAYGACMTAAGSWSTATWIGGDHHGGINPDECILGSARYCSEFEACKGETISGDAICDGSYSCWYATISGDATCSGTGACREATILGDAECVSGDFHSCDYAHVSGNAHCNGITACTGITTCTCSGAGCYHIYETKC